MTLAGHTRLSVVVQLVAGTLLGAWLLPANLRWAAPVFGLLAPWIVAGLGLVIEVAVGLATDPRTPAPSARSVVATWWRETVVSVRAFCITQPFGAGFAEPAIVRDPQRPAVLLVHGYLCNRAVWRPLLDHGTLAGCNVATINLEPVFCAIDDYAAAMHDAIEHLRAASGARQVTIVAHSMGGLAARVYLRDYGDAAVARVVTLATPHAGTVFGKLGIGINAKQMAHGSAFCAALADATASYAGKFVCLATRDDNLIVPRASPLLAGARHVLFEDVGHLALIEHEPAWRAVAAEIAPATTVAAEGAAATRGRTAAV